ncbi:MAG: beta-ketoacyl synthase N-terminal-like domain-containing protein [Pseudomonadota bacterium]
MNKVYITQAKAITSMGPDLDTLYEGLLENKTGIGKVKRFETNTYISPYAALIEDLKNTNNQSLIFDLSDKLLAQLSGIDKDCLLITASTKAGIDLLTKSPADLKISSTVLPSSLPGYISNKMGLKNKGFNINCACASSTIAIAKGASLIMMGHADSVLICCMDIVTQFVYSGFSALGAMSPFPAAPFDKNRQGLTLGEGAAAIVLMSEQKMESLNIAPLAQICSWGIASDAAHVTAPAKDGRGLKLAIKNACTQARVSLDDISAFNTHGTGTVYNDSMEIHVIKSLFSKKNIIANSIKGAIGHTLGAAGGIEVALCIKMLEKRLMPGTAGFINPQKDAKNIIRSDPQKFMGDYILTTNSGFGGINAAIVMKRSSM